MPLTPDWLQRLNRTTDYAELQEIFAELAAQAGSSNNNPELAATIDEAIRRLIEERTRDERELHESQSRYDSFKEDNRGFVGWFKRHLPFTETRRQESEHKGDVAEQTAEILADNLVIARAQIIKERLLPPETRRLGRRIADWQGQWDRERTQPASAAQTLNLLHAELARSRAFVDELKRDIDAFAGAEFREAADRQRRDGDLAAARHELDALDQEIGAETALKQTGLKLLVGHIAAELSATDSEFNRDGKQIESLQAALARLEESRAGFGKLVATVGQVGALAKQLQTWPEQLQQARAALAKIEAERGAAAQAGAAKTAIIQERQARVADAQRAAEQAAQMLASLQPGYDAHLAQRATQLTMAQPVEAEPPGSIVGQYQAARSAVDQAQAQLRDVTAALESARREATQAEAAVKTAADSLAAEQKKLVEFEKKEPQMRAELASHADRGQREFAVAAAALAAYLHTGRADGSVPAYRPHELAAGTFGWLGPSGLERNYSAALLQAAHDYVRHVQAATLLERLVQWQEAQKQSLEQERAQAHGRREFTWKRRCRELLGETLVEEACAGGLPT